MRIVVLGTRGFPHLQGGVESHCENLYTYLQKQGCEIIVFARKPYVGGECYRYKGIKVVPLWCPRNRFLEAIVHTLRGVFLAQTYQPQILHIHSIGPSLVIPLARLLGFKVIMTHHGPDYQRKKWNRLAKYVLKWGEFLGVTFAHKVVAISKTIAEEIERRYKRKVEIVPNGVGIWEGDGRREVGEGILKRYGLQKDRYILAVGRFVPEKGFDLLISAFNNLPINHYKLVLVGEADHPDRYSMALKKKAEENRRIVLTGFLDQERLRHLYTLARLFVLPSYYEGLPIVLLEALGLGVSCIVSDIPAHQDLGLDKERFFKAGDVVSLAEKMKEFIHRPLEEEERKRQRRYIVERYDWARIAQRMLGLYREIIEQRG